MYPGHGKPFGDAVGRIEANLRKKVRRLRKALGSDRGLSVHGQQLADRLVATAVVADQRQLTINETLADIADLRWSGLVERRSRESGVCEWFALPDTALQVTALLPS